MYMRICLAVCVFLLASCQEKPYRTSAPPHDTVNPTLKSEVHRQFLRDSLVELLTDGDLVFRKGNDFISETLAHLNDSSTAYSHCGIVFIENGYPFVYHCIGTSENVDGRMRRDSVKHFFSIHHNFTIGAYRYPFTANNIFQLQQQVQKFYIARPRFDFYFDIGDDSLLYCAEMVAKAINRSVGPMIMFSLLGNRFYYSVDDLFVNPYAVEIASISYMKLE